MYVYPKSVIIPDPQHMLLGAVSENKDSAAIEHLS